MFDCKHYKLFFFCCLVGFFGRLENSVREEHYYYENKIPKYQIFELRLVLVDCCVDEVDSLGEAGRFRWFTFGIVFREIRRF